MKKGIKILSLAATVFFLLTGAASAVLLDEIPFTYGKTPWVNLSVDLQGVPGTWTYTYTLSVLDDPGAAKIAVHALDIPVISLGVLPPGYSNVTWDPGPTGFYFESEQDGTTYLSFSFYDSPIAAGESKAFSFDSPYNPSSADYYIWNGAQSPAEDGYAAVGKLGGGNSSVPEPATLILVGIGFIGVGAYRHLRARGRA